MAELTGGGQLTIQVTNDENKSFGISIGGKKGEFKVQNMSPDGLAASAGMKLGDVLLSVDGIEVTGQDALFAHLNKASNGAIVVFTVQRGAPAAAGVAPVAAMPAEAVKMVPHPMHKQETEKYWGTNTMLAMVGACCFCGLCGLGCLYCYIEKQACFADNPDAGPLDTRLKDVMVTEEEAAKILVEMEAQKAAAAAAMAEAAKSPDVVVGTPVPTSLSLVVKNDPDKSFGMSLIGKNKVGAVAPTGLAHLAGIKPNDVILDVNGTECTGQDALFALFNKLDATETVTFTVAARV